MTREDEPGLGFEPPVKRAPAQDLTGISAAAPPLQADLLSPLLRAQQAGKAGELRFAFDADNLPLFQEKPIK
jgi:hypothetical protein